MSAAGPTLLLDENLGPRLLAALAADYPGSCHVEAVGLRGRPDHEVWGARAGFRLRAGIEGQ